MVTCISILYGFVFIPPISYYSSSTLYQDSLVSCSVFMSISEVVIGECADLLGQELLRGLRGVDGWQGDVKDQFTHQGREVAVTFLPQEAVELGALCDGDWRSLSMVFFGRDVANDDKAIRAHLLQSVGLLFDPQHGRLGVEYPIIN